MMMVMVFYQPRQGVCVRVCVCVCACVCVFEFAFVFVCVFEFASVFVCVFVFACVFVCMSTVCTTVRAGDGLLATSTALIRPWCCPGCQ